jgi:hypothetical protein
MFDGLEPCRNGIETSELVAKVSHDALTKVRHSPFSETWISLRNHVGNKQSGQFTKA